MAGVSSIAILRDVQTLFEGGSASGLTDRHLLDRFMSQRDEAAFEALVRRHGPMVLRVCHSGLRDHNDVQDAFQATFLILVRKSGSIRKLDSVGGWLYGVACRVAARARVEKARRRTAEERAALRIAEAVESPVADQATDMEFSPVVQEEVGRLPEKYRSVVVLCYWHGLTHEQAAAQLGCPLGTVRSRMARARNLLRRRLTRRGLSSLAGVVAAGLDGAPSSAGILACTLPPVPAALVQSTIRASVPVAFRGAPALTASGFATSLAQRVLWSMTMMKLKTAVAGVVLVGVVGVGGRFAGPTWQAARAQPPAGPQVVAPAGKPARTERNGGPEVIKSRVRGQANVMKLLLDGSRVQKGQVICELDSAALKDQLVNQKITSLTALSEYENSKLAREVAEIAVVEYEEGVFKNELLEIMGDIKIAEAELALAEDELTNTLDLVKRKLVRDVEGSRAKLARDRAKFLLEKAQSRHKLLLEYTKGKKIKTLKSAVLKAHSEELGQKAIWDLQVAKAKELERQIASCTIRAPRDGILTHKPFVQEGATVRESQVLFEIVPDPENHVEKQ